MTRDQICILIAIVIYLGFMVYLGARYSKSTKDSSDFYLGGRKLGPYVVAMSAEASDMSSWLLLGLPGVASPASASRSGRRWVWASVHISTGSSWPSVCGTTRKR